MPRNEAGVEELTSNKIVCDSCDLNIAKFRFIISEKGCSCNNMSVCLCEDCFDEFISNCEGLLVEDTQDSYD